MTAAVYLDILQSWTRLFVLGNDPHDQERFQRRVQETIEGRPVFVPTAEDVIVTKLRWKRRKDIDDVLGIIGVRYDRLDLDYVRQWTDQHGTRNRLEEMLSGLEKLDSETER
jgi:hypothetical protein